MQGCHKPGKPGNIENVSIFKKSMEKSGEFLYDFKWWKRQVFVVDSSHYWTFLFTLCVKTSVFCGKYIQSLSVVKNLFQENIWVWIYLLYI